MNIDFYIYSRSTQTKVKEEKQNRKKIVDIDLYNYVVSSPFNFENANNRSRSFKTTKHFNSNCGQIRFCNSAISTIIPLN